MVGIKWGQRAKRRRERHYVGKRVLWLKKTPKGNLRPVQAFIRVVADGVVLVEASDGSARQWVQSNRIVRR